jgi:adenylate cyclase
MVDGTRDDASLDQAMLYARDLVRLQTLKKAYERLLPTPLEEGELPKAELREATVLFTDVRGFTSLAERLQGDAAALLGVMNEHLSVVVRAVQACGGAVEKFGGDGVLATFGARSHQEDHRDRALAAALGAIGANERLNRRRSTDWGFRLEMGAALASGQVVTGPLGPPERWEMGVLGDTVNVAARLVARAAPSEVLMTDIAYGELSNGVKADLVGDLGVRGRIAGVRVFRIGMGGAQNPPPSAAA